MKKLQLAQLPTPIDRIKTPPTEAALWIKRDDQTGLELSGNKVRKLEYALQEALEQKADTVITCGGIQSNHARATAAACARLGLRCILLLQDDGQRKPSGNYFLDTLLGAETVFLSESQYQNELDEILQNIADVQNAQGHTAYTLPIGASNGIGTFGYYAAFAEILAQEKEAGVVFDTIVCAVGSGGTYAGLLFGAISAGSNKKIVGIPIAKDAAYFTDRVLCLSHDFSAYLPQKLTCPPEQIRLIDGWTGPGYAKNTEEDFAFIRTFARNEGIVLDPVYTGKAMRGLYESLQQGHPHVAGAKNILFIHTGGAFGLFGKEERFLCNGKKPTANKRQKSGCQ